MLGLLLSNTGNVILEYATAAISHYGTPQVVHSGQGSTYSAAMHSGLLADHRIVSNMTEEAWRVNAQFGDWWAHSKALSGGCSFTNMAPSTYPT